LCPIATQLLINRLLLIHMIYQDISFLCYFLHNRIPLRNFSVMALFRSGTASRIPSPPPAAQSPPVQCSGLCRSSAAEPVVRRQSPTAYCPPLPSNAPPPDQLHDHSPLRTACKTAPGLQTHQYACRPAQ